MESQPCVAQSCREERVPEPGKHLHAASITVPHLPGDGAPLRLRERRGGVGGAHQLLNVLHQRLLLLRCRPREHHRARHT